jgi:phosphonopyruvate decarboxylase
VAGFDAAFRAASKGAKPAFIHARIAPGSMNKLGRPTIAPADVARRFKDFLASVSSTGMPHASSEKVTAP